jgi:predicted ATP-binding protein involved in virulence
MRVERLELTHFRGIRQLTLEFPTQITVLVGINGAGKTAILDAIAMLLSRWVDQLLAGIEKVDHPVDRKDVRNGEKENLIALSVRDEEQDGSRWSLSTPSMEMGWLAKGPDDVSQLRDYTERLRERARQGRQDLLPILAYYSTDRGMWSSALEEEEEGSIPRGDRIAAYLGALPAGLGDFRNFIRWFKAREDLENERRAREQGDFEDPQLKGVRNAVEALMKGYSHLQVERRWDRMTIRKGREVVDIDQLSSGEKALLALVGDLARRMAMLRPDAPEPRLGRGVVLIDEVDLHLHPGWQRMLLPSLAKVFPNCQFIVTTHSPQVLSEVKPESIYLLERQGEDTVASRPESSFGRDSNRILEDLMGVDARPERIKEQLVQFFRLIDEGKLDEAKALRRELEAQIGSDEPSFAKGEVLIRRKEMLAGAPDRSQR